MCLDEKRGSSSKLLEGSQTCLNMYALLLHQQERRWCMMHSTISYSISRYDMLPFIQIYEVVRVDCKLVDRSPSDNDDSEFGSR